MYRGYTKSWRKKYEGRTASRGLLYLGAMDWLVGNANWKEGWHDGIKIERGQLFAGRAMLSSEWKVSEQTVRTILSNLGNDGFLTIRSTKRGSIITVLNFTTYQSNEELNQPTDQPTANQPPTNDPPLLKNEKNLKKVSSDEDTKESSAARKTKARPESPQDVIEYCSSRNNGLDGQFFWDKMEARGWVFRDGRPVKDWKACVRTWEKYGKDFQSPSSKSQNSESWRGKVGTHAERDINGEGFL